MHQEYIYTSSTITCYTVNGNTWFRGKVVATILEYANTKKEAIIDNVAIEDKVTLKELRGKIKITP